MDDRFKLAVPMETFWYYLQLSGFDSLPFDQALVTKDDHYKQVRSKKHYGYGIKSLRDQIEHNFTDSRISIPDSDFWDNRDPDGPYRDWTPEDREKFKHRLFSFVVDYHTGESLKPERDIRIPIEGEKICKRCDRDDGHLQRDHILALHLGGKDETKNLQWLCVICHKFKTTEDHLKRQCEIYREDTWRGKMWRYRLETHRRLNPPGAEKFHSYGEDPKTLWNYWEAFRINPNKKNKGDSFETIERQTFLQVSC